MTSPTPATPATPDFTGLRNRQQATWASGDYHVVGNSILLISELLCEAADLHGGWRVLDVATGSGNAALAAARRWCDVVGTDYVPSLLERARARADADGVKIDFREADAEKQPFPDASFDAVLSVMGAMFSPSAEATAAELVRVCKPGGRIGLASWTAEGFIGQSFKVVGKLVPPPPGAKSPLQWGSPERIQELFGASAASISCNRRLFQFRYRSLPHYLDIFRKWYGPMVKAFESLDEQGKATLEREMTALIQQHNRSGDSTLIAPSEYLEVVIVRK